MRTRPYRINRREKCTIKPEVLTLILDSGQTPMDIAPLFQDFRAKQAKALTPMLLTNLEAIFQVLILLNVGWVDFRIYLEICLDLVLVSKLKDRLS